MKRVRDGLQVDEAAGRWLFDEMADPSSLRRFYTYLREARKARRRRREAGRRRKVVVRVDAQTVERPVGGGDQNAPGGGVHEIARGRAEFAGGVSEKMRG
jgi:hypothetical protein